MKTSTHNKPQRITQAELAGVAAQAVSRALAARESCLRELSPQELAEVSGGAAAGTAFLAKGIIAGGRPVDMYASALTTLTTSPALNTSTLNAATLGAGMTRMV
jgi:hypothetical protein